MSPSDMPMLVRVAFSALLQPLSLDYILALFWQCMPQLTPFFFFFQDEKYVAHVIQGYT